MRGLGLEVILEEDREVVDVDVDVDGGLAIVEVLSDA